ncbi:MAG: hypothetical protein KDB03_23410 [Planctomycetales bacterium]|nr:hypothetical protein [Planctomycetales bacterium]
MTAAALLASTLMLGMMGTTWGMWRAWKAEKSQSKIAEQLKKEVAAKEAAWEAERTQQIEARRQSQLVQKQLAAGIVKRLGTSGNYGLELVEEKAFLDWASIPSAEARCEVLRAALRDANAGPRIAVFADYAQKSATGLSSTGYELTRRLVREVLDSPDIRLCPGRFAAVQLAAGVEDLTLQDLVSTIRSDCNVFSDNPRFELGAALASCLISCLQQDNLRSSHESLFRALLYRADSDLSRDEACGIITGLRILGECASSELCLRCFEEIRSIALRSQDRYVLLHGEESARSLLAKSENVARKLLGREATNSIETAESLFSIASLSGDYSEAELSRILNGLFIFFEENDNQSFSYDLAESAFGRVYEGSDHPVLAPSVSKLIEFLKSDIASRNEFSAFAIVCSGEGISKRDIHSLLPLLTQRITENRNAFEALCALAPKMDEKQALFVLVAILKQDKTAIPFSSPRAAHFCAFLPPSEAIAVFDSLESMLQEFAFQDFGWGEGMHALFSLSHSSAQDLRAYRLLHEGLTSNIRRKDAYFCVEDFAHKLTPVQAAEVLRIIRSSDSDWAQSYIERKLQSAALSQLDTTVELNQLLERSHSRRDDTARAAIILLPSLGEEDVDALFEHTLSWFDSSEDDTNPAIRELLPPLCSSLTIRQKRRLWEAAQNQFRVSPHYQTAWTAMVTMSLVFESLEVGERDEAVNVFREIFNDVNSGIESHAFSAFRKIETLLSTEARQDLAELQLETQLFMFGSKLETDQIAGLLLCLEHEADLFRLLRHPGANSELQDAMLVRLEDIVLNRDSANISRTLLESQWPKPFIWKNLSEDERKSWRERRAGLPTRLFNSISDAAKWLAANRPDIDLDAPYAPEEYQLAP